MRATTRGLVVGRVARAQTDRDLDLCQPLLGAPGQRQRVTQIYVTGRKIRVEFDTFPQAVEAAIMKPRIDFGNSENLIGGVGSIVQSNRFACQSE